MGKTLTFTAPEHPNRDAHQKEPVSDSLLHPQTTEIDMWKAAADHQHTPDFHFFLEMCTPFLNVFPSFSTWCAAVVICVVQVSDDFSSPLTLSHDSDFHIALHLR
jgi:hypothetical protein